MQVQLCAVGCSVSEERESPAARAGRGGASAGWHRWHSARGDCSGVCDLTTGRCSAVLQCCTDSRPATFHCWPAGRPVRPVPRAPQWCSAFGVRSDWCHQVLRVRYQIGKAGPCSRRALPPFPELLGNSPVRTVLILSTITYPLVHSSILISRHTIKRRHYRPPKNGILACRRGGFSSICFPLKVSLTKNKYS